MDVREIGRAGLCWVDAIIAGFGEGLLLTKIFPEHMMKLFATVLLLKTIQNDSCLCEYSEMACVVIGECQPPYL